MHDTSRVAGSATSITCRLWVALTHRGLQQHPTATALSVVQVALTLLIVPVTAVLLVPLIRARATMAQLALTAFMMLQISPISWSHHNTWYPLSTRRRGHGNLPLMYQWVSSLRLHAGCYLARLRRWWACTFRRPGLCWRSPGALQRGSDSDGAGRLLGLMAGTMPYQRCTCLFW